VADTVAVGQEIPLTLVNTRGAVDVYNMLIVPMADAQTVSALADLHAGKITIIDGFKRGYVNADAKSDLGT